MSQINHSIQVPHNIWQWFEENEGPPPTAMRNVLMQHIINRTSNVATQTQESVTELAQQEYDEGNQDFGTLIVTIRRGICQRCGRVIPVGKEVAYKNTSIWHLPDDPDCQAN